jgi:hypothetical protein
VSLDLRGVDQALTELLRIVAGVISSPIEAEVEDTRELARVCDLIGELPLNGDGLEVARGLGENERKVGAPDGDGDDAGCGVVVQERQSGAFARDPTALVVDHVCRGPGFHEREHWAASFIVWC